MKNRLLTLLAIAAMLLPLSLTAQEELCADQIDNDEDFLTDCADPDCEAKACDNAFPCQEEAQLYQIADGVLNEFINNVWMPIQGWNGGAPAPLNAMGYNVQDGLLYAIDATNGNLVTVSRNGIEASVPTTPALPTAPNNSGTYGNWYTGDMDLDGNLYVSGALLNQMAIINVPSGNTTILNFDDGTGSNPGNLGVADWAYLPATMDKLYGIVTNTNTLRVVNIDGTWENDITLEGYNCAGTSTATGAIFADGSGDLYASCNGGGFYRLIHNVNFSDFEAELLINTPSFSNNDGAGCPLSLGIPCPPADTIYTCPDCCDEVLAALSDIQDRLDEIGTSGKMTQQESIENELTDDITKAVLFQNTPNPFSRSTVISYEVQSKVVENVAIHVFDLNGRLKTSFDLGNNLSGRVTIEGYTLEPGMYLYSLVVNGKILDTKRMVLTQ